MCSSFYDVYVVYFYKIFFIITDTSLTTAFRRISLKEKAWKKIKPHKQQKINKQKERRKTAGMLY